MKSRDRRQKIPSQPVEAQSRLQPKHQNCDHGTWSPRQRWILDVIRESIIPVVCKVPALHIQNIAAGQQRVDNVGGLGPDGRTVVHVDGNEFAAGRVTRINAALSLPELWRPQMLCWQGFAEFVGFADDEGQAL